MKKVLLFATALCLSASAAAADNAGTVKQTTIRYNVPTCENCKTTTYEETMYPAKRVAPPAPACVTCAPYAKPAGKPCVDNNSVGVANPLFFVKPGQTSSETIVSFWKQPKGAYKVNGVKSGEIRGYDVAERIYIGLYDRLALHLEGGYAFQAPKTKQYKADMGSPVPHWDSFDGTVGLTYHLVDTCIFDMMVGLDGTWGRAEEKWEKRDGASYTFITPNVVAGFNFGPVTPYIRAAYSFADSKDRGLDEDFYHVAGGLYIQPSKYYAFDLSLEKIEREKLQYNAGFDVYPYKNVAVGMRLVAKKPFDHPMFAYGTDAHVKIVF